jgi:phosphoglycolate phosphatase-like HAD superfamily hydrolase
MKTEGMLMEAMAGDYRAALPEDAAETPALRLEPVHRGHPLRASFEQFIAARFDRAHGARVTHFLPHLLGVRDALSRWKAASGYGAAIDGPLFLEQYLDRPVEETLTAALGWPVHRMRIVEAGNLAAVSPGMARSLIPLLARHLHRLGYRWVVFTATRELRNSLARLGLAPLRLARADPARLRDGAASWGRYYQRDPVVMAGKIALGLRAGQDA